EGKRKRPPIGDPFGRRRIRARLGNSPIPQHAEISDAHRVAPRIARGIRINANETKAGYPDPRLLIHLAPARRLDRLADLHESARQGVGAGKGRMPAADEEHATTPVEDHAVGRKRWRLGKGHDRQMLAVTRRMSHVHWPERRRDSLSAIARR